MERQNLQKVIDLDQSIKDIEERELILSKFDLQVRVSDRSGNYYFEFASLNKSDAVRDHDRPDRLTALHFLDTMRETYRVMREKLLREMEQL